MPSEEPLEEICLAVWRQVLLEEKKVVAVTNDTFSVLITPKQKLKQINFQWDGRNFRGLEQNPHTKSRWAAMARGGQKVMQFLEDGRYVAVVADGKFIPYKRAWLAADFCAVARCAIFGANKIKPTTATTFKIAFPTTSRRTRPHPHHKVQALPLTKMVRMISTTKSQRKSVSATLSPACWPPQTSRPPLPQNFSLHAK
jgi:hypothetical protein